MKKVVFFISLFTISVLTSQEYVQTTTNSSFAIKSFSTTGNISLGFNGTNIPNGANANIQSKTSWGNWMTFIDGYSNDGYVFHNPKNGGKMELFHVDGVTGTKKFGVFTVLKSGNIGIGTTSPQEKLHVNGSIRGNASGGALRVKTAGGTLDIGAQNSSWAHIYTDRPKIIFNKDIYTTSNGFSSYNNDLILKTEGNERLRINDDTGNVGIGTTNPKEKLEVNGNIKFSSEYNNIKWPVNSSIPFGGGITGDDGNYKRLALYHGHSIDIQTGSNSANHRNSRLYINPQGDIGIGTRDPKGYKLAVAGDMIATEIKVKLQTSWPDYVFKDSYNLPTLNEVEKHITEKGQLINIPSAAEVVENGIYLGEMNAKLLEKIEELTLYTIAQEKEIAIQKTKTEKQEEFNQQLVDKNAALEARLARIESQLEKQ